MVNTLVDPAALLDFPGGPFLQSLLDVAVAAVRFEAGWHIAPEVTQTVKLDGSETTTLILPTKYLVNVTAVRDLTGNTPVAITGWRKTRSGMLSRDAGWPNGFESVEVDMVHGHPSTPPELLPVIVDFYRAAKSDPRVAQERLGAWSATFRGPLDETSSAAVLDRFTIRAGF